MHATNVNLGKQVNKAKGLPYGKMIPYTWMQTAGRRVINGPRFEQPDNTYEGIMDMSNMGDSDIVCAELQASLESCINKFGDGHGHMCRDHYQSYFQCVDDAEAAEAVKEDAYLPDLFRMSKKPSDKAPGKLH